MLDHPLQIAIARRQFLGASCVGAGAAALASLLGTEARAAAPATASGGLPGFPNFRPRARRVIWLTQAGAPSQIDLFDHKPALANQFDKDLPDSIRQGQRLTGMTSGQPRFPVAPSIFKFRQQGRSGIWMSELLPHTARIADDICVIRSLHTEAINHDPAMTMLQTGHQIAGRPSLGAWVSYGLGHENANLPAFVVMISRPTGPTNAQPLHERMWGAGFLPTRHQGVRFSPGRDPVLYLSDPPGMTRERRREFLDALGALNRMTLDAFQDPETAARIDQFEMAFRMQAAVPELADLSTEPAHTFDRYGPESRKPGSYAANCILARRLIERGVRFVQLYHRGWDQHSNCSAGLSPDGFHLRSRGGTGAGLVLELGRRDACDCGAADGRAGADLDDLGRLVGLVLAIAGQSGDLVLDSLLARLPGRLDDDLKALVVLEEAGIEFGFDGAGGRGAGEIRQAYLLRDACMEFEHGGFLLGLMDVLDGDVDFVSAILKWV
jgi:hypothetical protein